MTEQNKSIISYIRNLRLRSAALHAGDVYVAFEVKHAYTAKEAQEGAVQNLATIEPAQQREEALPIQLIKSSEHTTRATGTVTFESTTKKRSPVYFYGEAVEKEQRKAKRHVAVAVPPGFWMSRIARTVFFFSPKTAERVFEEIIADYRYEAITAEAEGRTSDLRWLRVQYWGAFIWSLVQEVYAGSLGNIIRALTRG